MLETGTEHTPGKQDTQVLRFAEIVGRLGADLEVTKYKYFLINLMVLKGTLPIPAVIGREAGYTIDIIYVDASWRAGM